MRRYLVGAVLSAVMALQIGCVLPAYDGNPTRRTQQLIFTSENLRLILDEWERFWFLDMPDHETPFRTHGGII